jgi:hypothetical protein
VPQRTFARAYSNSAIQQPPVRMSDKSVACNAGRSNGPNSTCGRMREILHARSYGCLAARDPVTMKSTEVIGAWRAAGSAMRREGIAGSAVRYVEKSIEGRHRTSGQTGAAGAFCSRATVRGSARRADQRHDAVQAHWGAIERQAGMADVVPRADSTGSWSARERASKPRPCRQLPTDQRSGQNCG